ncbi:MAG: heme-copper oxidase subunit III [Myxococcota bacterium]
MAGTGRDRFHVVEGGADKPGSGDLPQVSTGQLGMIIFLISLGVLFAGTMAGYLIVRFNNDTWRTAEQPGLPLGLLASTLFILTASVALHRAVSGIRKNNVDTLRLWLVAAFVLALGFLAGQTLNWLALVHRDLAPNSKSLYAFTFYMLTGVHALHVVGGFVPLGICVRNAYRGTYSSLSHRGVRYCAQYWHFLDVVWILMLSVMWAVT